MVYGHISLKRRHRRAAVNVDAGSIKKEVKDKKEKRGKKERKNERENKRKRAKRKTEAQGILRSGRWSGTGNVRFFMARFFFSFPH